MIYVIGKNGYIGSKLIKHLESSGYKVEGIGREDSLFCKNLEGPIGPDDIVFNCAGVGIKPVPVSNESYLKDNIVLPHRLAAATSFGCIGKMIHLSSYFEFTQRSLYAKSKLFTSAILTGQKNVSVVYLYNVFGYDEYPNRFMAGVKNAIKDGKTFVLTTPLARRDFVHIDHCLKGFVELIDKPSDVYHFGTGGSTTMIALLKEIKRMYPEFQFTVEDSNNYITECYKPRKPYFKGIDLMADIRDDIYRYMNKETS